MAIFHLSAKPPIARSSGRSATAAAAYRAGVRIADERTATVYDYTRKRGVIASRLILPNGNEVLDRQDFWNRVEKHHKRKDAVLAREVVVALPDELPPEEREALTWQFASEIATRFQVAVDVSVHAPSATGDQRNKHAHLLLSACAVTNGGALGSKVSALDPIHCRRNGMEDSVSWLRPRWDALCNEALARAGSDQRVDHRSHAQRGIAAIPSIHVGRGATSRRRRRLNARSRSLEVTASSKETSAASVPGARRVDNARGPSPVHLRR